MRAITLCLLVLASSTASAQKKGKECDPVPEEFQSFGVVYAECEVDKKARVSRHPRINGAALGVGGPTCMKAEIDLVVDIDGKVVPGSARLVSTNSQVYARELMIVIGETLFSPAKKGDSLVRQLHRYPGEIRAFVVSSADPSSRSRRPPPC